MPRLGKGTAAGLVAVVGLTASLVLFRPRADAEAAQPRAGAIPADLALVPADAAGFVHVRLADLWKNELFAGFRKTFEKAGPKAAAALDKQFVPAPSSIDRVTAFVTLDPNTREPRPFAILAFSAPFDPAQVAKVYVPEAEKKQAAGKTVYVDQNQGVAVAFPDNKHVVVGMPGALEAYIGNPVAKDGPMAGAIKLAAGGKPVVAAANIAALPIPPDAFEGVPAEVRPILQAKQIVLSLDLGKEPNLDLRAVYADAAAATDAEKAVRALAALGRQQIAKAKKELEDKLYDPNVKTPRPPQDFPEAVATVFALGALTRVDELLADEQIVKRNGAELGLTVALPREVVAWVGGSGAVGVGLLLPAVQKVREAASRTQSANNLKQIGLALHNYHDANGTFPPPVITDKAGKPLYSWRVAILPYIEQDAVYRNMKLDEPWDSEHNKKFTSLAIKTYMTPTVETPAGTTRYKAIVGPGAGFEKGKQLRIPADFPDGTSNTILVVESGDPIPWAKPEDIEFDPKKPLPKFNLPGGPPDLVQMLLCDGSVRAVNVKTVSEKTLRNAITRNDGMPLGSDW